MPEFRKRPKTPKFVFKLRKPQVAVLLALRQAKGPIPRTLISKRTGVAVGILCPMLGSVDLEFRARAEARGNCQSLLSLGFATIQELDIDGAKEFGYQATKEGLECLDDNIQAFPKFQELVEAIGY